MNSPKKIIIMLGVPGSGKGTQARLIEKTFGYTHISTGELLRDLVKQKELNSEEKNAMENMKTGDLVPDELIYKLAFTVIEDLIQKNKGIVLDGAIRTLAQAHAYEKFFEKMGVTDRVMVFEIAISDMISKNRLLHRAKEREEERSDDVPQIIEQRVQKQGNASIEPLREYYSKKGLLHSIDGKKTVQEVFAEITAYVTHD